jgi:hypothetical protein
MVYSNGEESVSRGLKPEVVAGLDVRDKSRTYLRSKSGSCASQKRKRVLRDKILQRRNPG